MSRYYFDTDDGVREVRDGDGVECASDDDARKIAARALAEMARDALARSPVKCVSVRVRDAVGRTVALGFLSFHMASI